MMGPSLAKVMSPYARLVVAHSKARLRSIFRCSHEEKFGLGFVYVQPVGLSTPTNRHASIPKEATQDEPMCHYLEASTNVEHCVEFASHPNIQTSHLIFLGYTSAQYRAETVDDSRWERLALSFPGSRALESSLLNTPR